MLAKYTTLILVLTVFQTAFFLIFLSTHKKGKLISNRILAAYFLAILLILGNSLLFRLQLHLRVPHLAFQGTKFIFLSSPILYFYTKSLTQEQFKFKPVDLWHLTPFILFSAFVFFVFDLRTAAEKIRLLTPPSKIINPALSLSLDIGLLFTSICLRHAFPEAVKRLPEKYPAGLCRHGTNQPFLAALCFVRIYHHLGV
jgi:hypothetical protein